MEKVAYVYTGPAAEKLVFKLFAMLLIYLRLSKTPPTLLIW